MTTINTLHFRWRRSWDSVVAGRLLPLEFIMLGEEEKKILTMPSREGAARVRHWASGIAMLITGYAALIGGLFALSRVPIFGVWVCSAAWR